MQSTTILLIIFVFSILINAFLLLWKTRNSKMPSQRNSTTGNTSNGGTK